MLSEIAHQGDAADARILSSELFYLFEGAVPGSVIDEDELAGILLHPVEFGKSQLHNLTDGMLGIVTGNDDRY